MDPKGIMTCPECESDHVDVPMVDNGVGMQQCGPAGCLDCGWVQDDDDPSLHLKDEV